MITRGDLGTVVPTSAGGFPIHDEDRTDFLRRCSLDRTEQPAPCIVDQDIDLAEAM